ncbi:MAG: hypothetical protein QN157_01505 [Armatimonadota bacterium]|nr:hypothetical protein [Armatimonadota bacterium]
MEEVLATLAAMAGYPLTKEDLKRVGAYLADYWRELEALRAVVLPEDIEPVVQFRLERWS